MFESLQCTAGSREIIPPLAPSELESLRPPTVACGEQKVLLLTHPRSCATAIELYLEQCGYPVLCNVFDRDYHFIEHAGVSHPRNGGAAPEDRFDKVAGRLQQYCGPLLVRSAAYTLRPHFDSNLLEPLLRSFDERILLIRHPAYALASHRRLAERHGETVTLEEAGYVAQLRLALLMERLGLQFRVLDAHDVLANPKSTLGFLGLEQIQGEVYWERGMRERWGLWPHWKEEVAKSTNLRPFTLNPERELIGMQDPLFAECYAAYRGLLRLGAERNVEVQ